RPACPPCFAMRTWHPPLAPTFATAAHATPDEFTLTMPPRPRKDESKRQRRRRGNGEGSIFQRKSDGRWCGNLTVGYSPSGKRLSRTVYGKTKREVQEKLASIGHQIATGTLTEAGRMSTGDWMDYWLSTIAKPTIRANTHASYAGYIKNHIKPRLGRVALGKLSPVHVQSAYSEMLAAGVSAAAVNHVHAVLRRALNIALRQNMIVRNPCLAVDPPRAVKPQVQSLSAEQARTLLKAAGDCQFTAEPEVQDSAEPQDEIQPSGPIRFNALIVLAVTTGLRQGELFGLQWPDLDLEGGIVSVRRTLVEVSGTVEAGDPKSAASARAVKLPQTAVEALRQHKAQILAEGLVGSPWAFCDSEGGPLRKSNFSRRVFKPLLERAGLNGFHFHTLRHTHATLMLTEGVHPKIVQARLCRLDWGTRKSL
ncbi:MAG: tyrosine-type recombinase/integrase, partial [Planctomycetaceae bacterium]